MSENMNNSNKVIKSIGIGIMALMSSATPLMQVSAFADEAVDEVVDTTVDATETSEDNGNQDSIDAAESAIGDAGTAIESAEGIIADEETESWERR